MKNFIEFCNEVNGYTFYSKKSGNQIFRFEMFWSGLTPSQCFKMFNVKEIIHPNYEQFK
jgi:hypothetical protein